DAPLARRVAPRRGVLLRSGPQPATVRRVLLEASYYAAKLDAAETSLSFSLQQLCDGSLLLGGTRSFSGFNGVAPTAAGPSAFRARAVDFGPSLAGIPFPPAPVGSRPWTPDGLPLVGPTGIDGFWIAAGHEGDGVTLAPATAEIIAALITGAGPP